MLSIPVKVSAKEEVRKPAKKVVQQFKKKKTYVPLEEGTYTFQEVIDRIPMEYRQYQRYALRIGTCVVVVSGASLEGYKSGLVVITPFSR